MKVLVFLLVATVARAQTPTMEEANRLWGESQELEQAGQYGRAAESAERAIEIFKKVAGAEHPNVSGFELRLASLRLTAGEYQPAETIYRRVLLQMEKAHGADSPMLLNSLSSLGTLYVSMGNFDQGRAIYERALKIARADNPSSLNVAVLVGAVGAVHVFKSEFDQAIPLLKESLEKTEAILGKDHADVAKPVAALAAAYDYKGDTARAEPLYRRALAMRERQQGAQHPQTALMRHNLAMHLLAAKKLDDAETMSRRALADTEATLGAHHTQTGNLSYGLAAILFVRGKDPVPILERAAEAAEHVVRNARLTATETRMSQLLQLYSWQEASVYAMAAARPGDAALVKTALAVALLRKGRSIDEAADLAKAAQAFLDERDRKKLASLAALRGQIAQNAMAGVSDTKKLEAEAEKLEQELTLKSLPLRARVSLPGAREIVSRVAKALPPDGALVEIVLHRKLTFTESSKDALAAPFHYAAFVLTPDGKVRFVPLGEAGVIDAEVRAASAMFVAPQKNDLAPSQALHARVIKPLALGDAKQVAISPEGQLHLVPFAALHDGEKFLIDRVSLSLVGSGRDLLRERKPQAGVVVLADPKFSLKKHSPLLPAKLPPLPGTRQEAEELRKKIPTAKMMLGAAATEAALLAVRAPGVLHVATHGVFLSDLDLTAGSRGLAVVSGSNEPTHPLLRSALVLSDGEATALELLGMNLWGTQLVVLSACDTGRGEIKSGQGVYGLRRALQVAGAETVVSSLWRVDDAATRDLMTRFYGALLEGSGRAEALRKAALEVRATHAHPYFWAPFVAVGYDGPLVNVR